jgi:ribosomal protein L11 methyltransferase
MAFGTGHHPSTRACLEVLERSVAGGESVLDLGSGTGILAIVALRLGAASAVCLDVDPDAVRATTRNLRLSGLAPVARACQGTVPHPEAAPGSFDLVLANISARVLIEQAFDIVRCLAPEGRLLGSGYTLDRAEDVRRAFEAAGARIRETMVIGDWVTVVGGRGRRQRPGARPNMHGSARLRRSRPRRTR